ncbi:hypothetical protein ARMGADRAFT_1025087 [Armillaria gallica]|uniref:Uncharacterized protein n=1 Tax=Armillaria gallica TaxID=47427 RepID=A0A2H3E5D5_ARMGA|nr:hypothetical protein ARMGADRAFT_1025087 [Armillaria gallica]
MVYKYNAGLVVEGSKELSTWRVNSNEDCSSWTSIHIRWLWEGYSRHTRHSDCTRAHVVSIHDTILPAAISAPNTSSRYQRLDVLPPCVNAGKGRSCARPYDCTVRGNGDTQQPPDPATLGEKPRAGFMFDRDIEMGTRPSLMLVGVPCWGTGSALGRMMATLTEGASKAAWSGILGISADGPPYALKFFGRVGGKGDCSGLLGRGDGPRVDERKELAYMVSGKDVDWLPAHFAKAGKSKHREARIYVGISEQSVLRLRASAHPLRPFILILPLRSYYTGF